MSASNNNVNEDFAKELEEELMKYTTNHEDCKTDPLLVDRTEEIHGDDDVDADVVIMERTKSDGNELVESECADETESSSSFGDSDSDVENVDTLGHSEAYASDLEFDMWFKNIGRMRNKKLTAHWRSYIRPLMWRCKWTEMQIEKLEAQAREYDKKLEKLNKQKQVQFDESSLENLGVKSIPFASDHARSKLLRRKKRRRNEATMDVDAYMSHHNIFSYYENRKLSTVGASMANGLKNPKLASDDEGNDEPSCLETSDSDNVLQHIFQKMDFLQSRVGTMRSRVEKLTSDAEKLSNFSLSIPCEGLINIHQNNGERMSYGSYIASQLVSEYNNAGNDEPVPQSAVADLNGSSNPLHFAGPYENEEVLIDNQRVKEEMMNSFEKVKPIERPPQFMMIQPNVPKNNGRPPRIRKRTVPKRKTKN